MRPIFLWQVVIILFMSGWAQAQPARSSYAQLEADAATGYLGKEDWVDLGAAKVYFTPPKDWVKEANVDINGGKFFYFLRYRPAADNYARVIFLTGIKVSPNDTDVLAYSRQIVEGLRNKTPTDVITDPRPVKIKKTDAAYFERTSPEDGSFWARYQFLIGGRVLKLQLMDTKGIDKKDVALLQKLAKSIRIEQINE